ncbi:MAG: Iron-sulfur cluster-binding protein [uncultured Caballeronia sp.]|nr:MAG: Iron-sulfur cluster-binding protein [uncultured Caballeronia sp.]
MMIKAERTPNSSVPLSWMPKCFATHQRLRRGHGNALSPRCARPQASSQFLVTATVSRTLAERIEDLLPQTQCTKCGYPACRPYADAIAAGEANYNQCPPGGAEGIARLAALLGKPVIPLDTTHGVEQARPVAVIDENVCIGCTLCMQACPVDAIVGAAKQMHTVIAELCTGCDLCVPPCPVDCIAMVPVTGERTGWDAWSQEEADAARARHDRHMTRLAREHAAAEARASARQAPRATQAEPKATPVAEAGAQPPSAPVVSEDEDPEAKKRAIIQAALERARKKKEEMAKLGTAPKNTEHVSAAVQAQIDEAEVRRRRIGLTGDEDDPRTDDGDKTA